MIHLQSHISIVLNIPKIFRLYSQVNMHKIFICMTYLKVHNFGHFLCQIFWIYWNIICKFKHSNLQHLPANSAQFLLFKMVLYFIFDQWNQKLFDFLLFELLISRTFPRIRFIPSLVWVYSHHHPWKTQAFILNYWLKDVWNVVIHVSKSVTIFP